MGKLIFKKLATVLAVVMTVMFLNFMLLYSSPVDPVALQLSHMGVPPTADTVAAIRAELGLDRPLMVQYGHWLVGLLRGEFGYSLAYGMPIGELLREAIPRTALLTVSSLMVAAVLTLPLSVAAFVYRNRPADYLIRFFSFVGQAMPTFWLGLLLIYVVCMRLRWLPVTVSGGVAGLILPSLALGIWVSGFYIRRIRAALLEEFRKPYIVGAKARGLSPRVILTKYLFPNSMIAPISMLAITTGELLGGAVVAESVFGWRGMGMLMTEAILMRDYPLMQAYVLWGCLTFIGVNALADIWLWRMDTVRRRGQRA